MSITFYVRETINEIHTSARECVTNIAKTLPYAFAVLHKRRVVTILSRILQEGRRFGRKCWVEGPLSEPSTQQEVKV
ncbi:hypothetical protein KSC_016420 [Ktedonobacter sp. SOSP1-52]|nr:hypothetical protein KSC_016420 [Ktedonobacter sp. SOSP1-52]